MVATVAEAAAPGAFVRGAAFAAAAAVCWSMAAVIVRHLDLKDVEVSFWRSIFMLLALLPALVWQRRALALDLAVHWRGMVLSGFLLAVTFVSFIVALGLTSVANIMVVLAANPFITAFFAWVLLKERIAPVTLAAMAVAAGGLVLTVVDSVQLGQAAGMLLALLVPTAFALNTIFMRRARTASQLPTIAFAAVFSALMVLPFADPAALQVRHLPWLLLLGPLQLLMGLWLFSRALRHIGAAQAALIGVIEMVLAPFWVWLAHGEAPTALTLAGGAIVIGAVVANGLFQLRAARA